MSYKNLISVLVIQILLLFEITVNSNFFKDVYIAKLRAFYTYLVSHNLKKDELQKSIDAFININNKIINVTTN